MSALIRPLPVEAAPQRTESDATISSQPKGAPRFGEVLSVHLDQKKEDPKEEAGKKPADADASMWALLGVQLLAPQPLPVSKAEIERGHPSQQVLQPVDQLADKDVRAPSATEPQSQSETAAASQPLLQLLTPATEMQKISPTPVQKPEEIAGKTPETGEKLRGILDAKQPAMLLTIEKHDATISLGPHRLFDLSQIEPASIEQALPVLRPVLKAMEQPIEFRTESIQDTFSPTLRIETPHTLLETPHVTDIRTLAVVDSIREHVQVLRVSQQNELNVVLRPDAHTELFLQIRQVDGQIHLQARCERGDFTWLDSQWNAVRNTLANQGVRVEPLQSAFRGQDSSSSMLMHDQRGSQRDQRSSTLSFSFEQESPKQTKRSSRPTGSGPRPRGWQSWA